MKITKCFLSLALALTIASGALAGDDDKKEAKGEKPAAGQKGEKGKGDAAARREAAKKRKGEAGARRQPPAPSAMFLRGVELSKEQQAALAPIDKEFGPKFAEVTKAQRELLTEEQRKAIAELLKKARETKEKPGPELRKQMAELRKLSPEQQKKGSELRAALGKLRTDYLAKAEVILTPEQKEKLKSRRGGARGDRKPGDKKPGEGQKKPAGERRKKDGEKPAAKEA